MCYIHKTILVCSWVIEFGLLGASPTYCDDCKKVSLTFIRRSFLNVDLYVLKWFLWKFGQKMFSHCCCTGLCTDVKSFWSTYKLSICTKFKFIVYFIIKSCNWSHMRCSLVVGVLDVFTFRIFWCAYEMSICTKFKL